ncbi:hypothetical protein SKAU_G00097900 [Synaphobranchus kaupii]|uniref:Uncharacterized protein n=1 Tax=Synaphobranchus kaupii TaxID=118154 RepID=A0A9Q1FY74_SYNKA|nr:hypothetical protein SKAU_G00097900 [Synaphobranchus kaupii]
MEELMDNRPLANISETGFPGTPKETPEGEGSEGAEEEASSDDQSIVLDDEASIGAADDLLDDSTSKGGHKEVKRPRQRSISCYESALKEHPTFLLEIQDAQHQRMMEQQ